MDVLDAKVSRYTRQGAFVKTVTAGGRLHRTSISRPMPEFMTQGAKSGWWP